MPDDVVIQVENVGKRYRINSSRGTTAKYKSIRDLLAGFVSYPFRRLGCRRNDHVEDFWALKEVSFEVKKGERVGVIGRNGAGKSTLLKILSRITEPTTGRIELNGRVASLLEVGTGFHPELTGRENIYLNGAILGMKRWEINNKFDDIVQFAEVEKFLNTPVKHFSSGMYVRLAFAVAAHLEPEILLVDEVLAVGDSDFQKKCLGKMNSIADRGATVLFVSHNISLIQRLCPTTILLNGGSLLGIGSTPLFVEQYSKLSALAPKPAVSSAVIRVVHVQISGETTSASNIFSVEESISITIDYEIFTPSISCRCALIFKTEGVVVFATVAPRETTHLRTGLYCVQAVIPNNFFAEREYVVDISIFRSQGAKEHLVLIPDALFFRTFDPISGNSARGDYAQAMAGLLQPKINWSNPSIATNLTD